MSQHAESELTVDGQTKQARGGSVCVVLRHFTEPSREDREALAAEAERLARFMRPEAASHTIRFEGP
jgi:hypothetical protein